jgi:hypothetical protein
MLSFPGDVVSPDKGRLVGALQGKARELPLIGKYRIIKQAYRPLPGKRRKLKVKDE